MVVIEICDLKYILESGASRIWLYVFDSVDVLQQRRTISVHIFLPFPWDVEEVWWYHGGWKIPWRGGEPVAPHDDRKADACHRAIAVLENILIEQFMVLHGRVIIPDFFETARDPWAEPELVEVIRSNNKWIGRAKRDLTHNENDDTMELPG